MAILKDVRIGNQREVLIYALTEPGTDVVRYVGKTVRSARKRHSEHIFNALQKGSRLPVHNWIRKQYARGAWSCMWHLENVPHGEDWAERERYWINKFRDDGHKLLNLTNGGDGLPGLPRPQAVRDAIAAKLRTGAQFDCERCGTSFWRKQRDIKAGHNRFCSKPCYQSWQIGKPKGVKK
ncbi:MAG: hypothetical protein B7Z31_04820 [Rhodobacterales bacterium 12-65-15]|nr:MAG: hypothetical protein B7Z31_04820 [Rhodobacterales bacterium 12-65-15]